MRRCLGCMEEYDSDNLICPLCGYDQNTPAEESYCLPPGTILQKRYIVGRIARYDNCEAVYMAYDALNEQKVYINEYLPQSFSDRTMGILTMTLEKERLDHRYAEGLRLYVENAEKLTKVTALSLTAVLDSFQANKTGYMVTEYFEGQTLRDILTDEFVLSYDQALEITMRMLITLKVIHAAGITHCNISPDSVYITNDGIVKMTACGECRQALKEGLRAEGFLSSGFAAPEQYSERNAYGPWSDVYGTAALLYFMLTGTAPPDALERRKKDTLLALSALGVSIPKKVDAIVLAAMSLGSKDRIKSSANMEKALISTSSAPRQGMAGWLRIALITFGAIVVILAALYFVLGSPFDKADPDEEENEEQVTADQPADETDMQPGDLLPDDDHGEDGSTDVDGDDSVNVDGDGVDGNGDASLQSDGVQVEQNQNSESGIINADPNIGTNQSGTPNDNPGQGGRTENDPNQRETTTADPNQRETSNPDPDRGSGIGPEIIAPEPSASQRPENPPSNSTGTHTSLRRDRR